VNQQSRRDFLIGVPAAYFAGAVSANAASSADELKLIYDKPARSWNEAVPLGNGTAGAMVYGGIEIDHINLNADTLWSGPHQGDPDNPDALHHLPEVRQLVADKKYAEATELCKKMQGPYTEAYQPLGDVRFQFFNGADRVENYRRELDLDTAIATVTYTAGGVNFSREIFVSAPDRVLVVRVTADRPGSVTFSVGLDSQLRSTNQIEQGRIVLRGKAPLHSVPHYLKTDTPQVYDDAVGKGMYFAAIVDGFHRGGRVLHDAAGMRFEHADEVVLHIAVGTGFRTYDNAPNQSVETIVTRITQMLDAVENKKYVDMRTAHIADHQRLFRRVTLSLGPAKAAALPTDARIKSFAANPDPQLVALWFQYGRYLLIASSRPNTEPANLQGIWNDSLRPGWSSNHTLNINTQMNYWLAEVCALPECHEPLIQFIAQLSDNGEKTARTNYGIRGWTAHHNSDLWRRSNPVGDGDGAPMWANWPLGGAWLCRHIWEHYAYSLDRDYLVKAWPVLHGAAEFCLNWLVDDGNGGLTTSPSVSPENSFKYEGKPASVSAGSAMDLAIIHDLFTNCIQALDILGVDGPFREILARAKARLVQPKIGKFGQLQEWSEDFEENDQWHRHQSPFYGLFPGSQFTPDATKDIAQAIAVGVDRRTTNAPHSEPGWTYAWLINLRARLHQAEKAYEMVCGRINQDCVANFFCGTKQIDGTLGGVAGIAEMLLQSHAGEIHFLPALPAAWPSGSFTGLRARGGYSVDLTWQNGRAVKATVRTTVEGKVRLRAPSGQKIRGGDTLTMKRWESVDVLFT
jgi:alpha-L-fucosidase 2